MGQAHDQSVDGRAARRRFHLGPGRAVPPIADVVADAVVEQHRVLRDDSVRAALRLLRPVANVLAVNGDPAGCYIITAGEQAYQGGFARDGKRTRLNYSN